MEVGQVQRFSRDLQEQNAQKFFKSLANGADWTVELWRDTAGVLFGARVDGLDAEQVAALRQHEQLRGFAKPTGTASFAFSPLSLRDKQKPEDRLVVLSLRRGRVVTTSRYGWERMDIGDDLLVCMTWAMLRTSLEVQMVRRSLYWSFLLTQRFELNEDLSAYQKRAGYSWWLVKRTA
jgi:hypothetical protein